MSEGGVDAGMVRPVAPAQPHGAAVSLGGEGKPGRVVDIRGWDVETGRSVASVTWADGTTNVYRVGHKGKVDLKCLVVAPGGFYYKEHLPRLGEHPGGLSNDTSLAWSGRSEHVLLRVPTQANQRSCSAG